MKQTKELKDIIKEINKKFGKDSISILGDAKKIDFIPTGSFSLDKALGIGGLPRGRIIEILGTQSGGKTTLALNIIAQAQKLGLMTAFIDAEHSMNSEYAQKLGIDTNKFFLSQPFCGEDALNILGSLIATGEIAVVVIDSVAALTPRAEIEGQVGIQLLGLQARMMSQALRKFTAIAAKSNTMIIFINQIRNKIGVTWGSNETTPGGRALEFYSSVRLDVRRIAKLKDKEEFIGSRVRVKVIKNKVAPPFIETEIDVLFTEGICYEKDILDYAIKKGIVKKEASTYSFNGEKLGVGIPNVVKLLKEDKELLEEIKLAIC